MAITSDYVPAQYPKWRYHAAHNPKLVKTPDEMSTLTPHADGWRESPSEAEAVQHNAQGPAVVEAAAEGVAPAWPILGRARRRARRSDGQVDVAGAQEAADE